MNDLISLFNGLIRPLVTLLFALGLLYGFVANMISGEVFVSIVSVVLGFYFTKRDQLMIDTAAKEAAKNEAAKTAEPDTSVKS